MTRKPRKDTRSSVKKVPHAESSDLAMRPVISAVAAIFGLIGIALLFSAVFFAWPRYGPHRYDLTSIEKQWLSPPAPRLDITPSVDRAAIEGAAAAKLQGYAWVDKTRQRVRIPIDRAMELTVQQGWPDDAGKVSP
jgi:hypothetical protein